MAIHKSKALPKNVPIAIQATFRQSFVKEIHRLLSAAYKKLIPSNLKNEAEPAITGFIAKAMRELFDEPKNTKWARFAIHDDPPQNSLRKGGTSRPRVDIEVESTELVPHPRFQFEAKRLYDRTDCVAEYVGPDGLGCFLNGKYGVHHPDAGMLGYVQHDDEPTWLTKIEDKLDKERNLHNLATTGKVWKKRPRLAGLDYSYQSSHDRTGNWLEVHHTLLRCY